MATGEQGRDQRGSGHLSTLDLRNAAGKVIDPHIIEVGAADRSPGQQGRAIDLSGWADQDGSVQGNRAKGIPSAPRPWDTVGRITPDPPLVGIARDQGTP